MIDDEIPYQEFDNKREPYMSKIEVLSKNLR